jgi:hypothetical protein
MSRSERHTAWLFGIVVALVSFGAPAFAADSRAQAAPVPGAGLGALFTASFCISRRKQEIGGWLLYYYIQLYLGAVLSIPIFALSFNNYRPSSWSVQPALYPLFLLSTVPGVLIPPVQLIIAERLRQSRDSAWLPTPRHVLWIELAAAVLAILLDSKYFDLNSAGLDAVGLIWPGVWLPYFYISNRVNRVFVRKDWLTRGPLAALPS